MANPFERPPGGSREMVWARCPKCGGKGTIKESDGNTKTCAVCRGKRRIQTR